MRESGKKAKQRARWLQVRAKGRWHFILWRGVVGWGLLTAILFSILVSVTNENIGFIEVLLIAAIAFPIGGFFWGLAMWQWYVRQGRRQGD